MSNEEKSTSLGGLLKGKRVATAVASQAEAAEPWTGLENGGVG